jgi:hypothetical protein
MESIAWPAAALMAFVFFCFYFKPIIGTLVLQLGKRVARIRIQKEGEKIAVELELQGEGQARRLAERKASSIRAFRELGQQMGVPPNHRQWNELMNSIETTRNFRFQLYLFATSYAVRPERTRAFPSLAYAGFGFMCSY